MFSLCSFSFSFFSSSREQVCNISDCLKIAIDFISPENVPRCVKLSREYQDMAKDGAGKAWKEDILQLNMNLWYAWRMCRRFDESFKEKEKGIENQEVASTSSIPSN